jgi:response regulator of citrate/malate metabolism
METDRIKIVIVEDDSFYGEILRKYVCQVMERMVPPTQTSVIHFASAKECLESLDSDTRLFLLDHNLGDSNAQSGLDLLKVIKERCPNSETIIVTNHSDFATINEFTLQGADRYILKNQDTPIRIITTLKQLLGTGVSPG